MVGWFVVWSLGLLVSSLTVLLISWRKRFCLVGWMDSRLLGWLAAGWVIGWMNGRLPDRLASQLIGR